MAATSVDGVGHGAVQTPSTQALNKVINVPHCIFTNPSNDGDTIPSTVSVVFMNTTDDGYSLTMPSDGAAVGRSITMINNTVNDENEESCSLIGNFFQSEGGYNISAHQSLTFTFDGAYWWITAAD